MAVECLVEARPWSEIGIEALAERACAATLAHLDVPEAAEIALLACTDRRIAELNEDFRGKPTPTNVLSWPVDERDAKVDGDMPDLALGPDPSLGDIAIAYETCRSEAEAAGRELADHATHLIVHGTLHLLGFDHIRDADAILMEGIEIEILGKLGIADPYRLD